MKQSICRRKMRYTARFMGAVLLTGLCRSANAQSRLAYLDDVVTPPGMVPTEVTPPGSTPSGLDSPGSASPTSVPPAPEPASLGQQPFPPAEKEPDLTPSQSNSNQLNQLFQFENTPDNCAAGEGYVSGEFTYLKFPGTTKEYRYQIQGQYAFTDQIAAGAYIPVVTSQLTHSSTGMGDVEIYGQYKLDQFINPEIVNVTFQLDMILPTGDRTAMQDTGKFGVRPLLLAYKDFGQHGPGDFGLYGLFGFTLTTNTDVRFGVAATYQYQNLVGIFEFFDQAGAGIRPLLEVTPGLAYRGFAPWEIAVGVPVGVNSGTPDWGVSFKLTYVFQN